MPNLDSEFAKSFSQIAFADLRDKTPGLFERLIGFQVLDANEDQTKAVGIFGFKVGDHLVLAPVFFLSGELKGGMLYLKDQDTFVPLSEGWVSDVLGKRPRKLGDSDHSNTVADINRRSADLSPYYLAPSASEKFGSSNPDFRLRGGGIDIPAWNHGTIQPWAQSIVKAAAALLPSPGLLSLPEFLRREGPVVAVKLAAAMKNTVTAEAVLEFHTLADVLPVFRKSASAAESDAQEDRDRNSVGPYQDNESIRRAVMQRTSIWGSAPGVEVITANILSDPWTAKNFSDEDKTKLLSGEIVVRDNRTNKPRVFKTDTPRDLVSPDTSGLHDVLTSEGNFVTVLVIQTPLVAGSGRAAAGGSCVVDAAAGSGTIIPNSGLFARQTSSDALGFLDYLSENGSALSEIGENDRFVLVTPDRRGTVPMRVLRVRENADGEKILFVSDETRPHSHHADTPVLSTNNRSKYEQHNYKVRFTNRTTTIRNWGDELLVPSTAVVIKLEDLDPYCCNEISYANPDAALSRMTSRGVLEPVKIYCDGFESGYALTARGHTVDQLSKSGALRELVGSLGIPVDIASGLVDSARSGRVVRVLLEKTAVDASGRLDDPSLSPTIPSGEGSTTFGRSPANFPAPQNVPVSALRPTGNRQNLADPENDSDIHRIVNRAQQTGQREIFDAAVVGSLVKSTNATGMTEKYTVDLTKALDRIGRILFLYYQHPEAFSDRYGEEDLQKLEDSLQDVFRSMGDLVLFLKARALNQGRGRDSGQTAISENKD